MEIRRIVSTDAPALRELRLRALADAPEAFTTTLGEAEARPPAYWEAWARERSAGPSGATFVAVEGGRWCGMVSGAPSRDDRRATFVFGLWVAPEARRLGLATALMAALAEWAKGGRMALAVYASNAAARALYDRLGFKETGIECSPGREPLVHLARDL